MTEAQIEKAQRIESFESEILLQRTLAPLRNLLAQLVRQ